MIVKARLLEQGAVILDSSKGQITQKQAGQNNPQDEKQDDSLAFFSGNSQTRKNLQEGHRLNDLAPNPWGYNFQYQMLAFILEKDFSKYKLPWEAKKIIQGEKPGSMKLGRLLYEDCVKVKKTLDKLYDTHYHVSYGINGEKQAVWRP